MIISTIVVGETPSADDGAAKAVGYWADNKDEVIAGAIIAAFSTVFDAVVRGSVARDPGSVRRSRVAAGLDRFRRPGGGRHRLVGPLHVRVHRRGHLGRRTRAGDVDLSVLQADFFFPLAVGFAVFLLASGLALLRGAAFPNWPGWVALVLGVICVTPGGFFGVLGGLAWILGISVMLFMRGAPTVPGTPATQPLGPPD